MSRIKTLDRGYWDPRRGKQTNRNRQENSEDRLQHGRADKRPEAPSLSAAGFTAGEQDRIARALKSEEWLSLSLTPIKSVPVFEYRSRLPRVRRIPLAGQVLRFSELLRRHPLASGLGPCSVTRRSVLLDGRGSGTGGGVLCPRSTESRTA